MLLLLHFILVKLVVTSSQYQDCTNQFKNQIAMFEYRYYPGWWSTPDLNDQILQIYLVSLAFANDIPDAKANKDLRFTLHDCGEDTVCIESLSYRWNGYYLEAGSYYLESGVTLRPRLHTTLHDVKQNPSYKHKIYCTSCQPDTDTYHDCQIFNVESQRYWYTKQAGTHKLATLAQGYPNWFQWRIVSPQTREYWAVSDQFENCDEESEEVPVYASFQTSISSSVMTTTTVEQKIEVGLEAITLLKKLGETTVRWTTANVRAWAEQVTQTIGSAGTKTKMVKPGKKWVIEQFVGEAAFNTIKSSKFRFCDIPCSSNSNSCPKH